MVSTVLFSGLVPQELPTVASQTGRQELPAPRVFARPLQSSQPNWSFFAGVVARDARVDCAALDQLDCGAAPRTIGFPDASQRHVSHAPVRVTECRMRLITESHIGLLEDGKRIETLGSTLMSV